MKTLLTTLMLGTLFAAPAFAVDASSNTTANTNTTVTTGQDSGVSLSGKAKVLPHASINTGDNTATTDVRTSVDADSDASASTSTRSNTEVNQNHRERGRGHKYGHDRDR